MSSVHHPTGITIESVGIEAKSNGQSRHQHDVCGEEIEEDVVLRLWKVQILNSQGKEETVHTMYQMVFISVVLDFCIATLLPMPKHLMTCWYK
jgi:hypothetical protein